MRRTKSAPSLTSLPQAPEDETRHRVRQYAMTMTIRIVCFGLMVVVQPYGWYTWVFGIAAAVLPYFAVVIANAGSDQRERVIESPEYAIEASRPAAEPEHPETVITLHESRQTSLPSGVQEDAPSSPSPNTNPGRVSGSTP